MSRTEGVQTPEGVSCMTAPDMVIAQRTKDGPYGWDRGEGTPSSRVKCWAHYNAENSGWIVVLERGGNQQLSAWVHGSADAVRRLCVRLVRWGIGISLHNSHAARRGRLAPPLPPNSFAAAAPSAATNQPTNQTNRRKQDEHSSK